MRTTSYRTRRGGFTLVELMVSAAVSVIIMTVLATAFQTGIDTMREMKSVTSLQDNLRAASNIIRRDLQADHFQPDPTAATSSAKLSGQKMYDAAWTHPKGGFFRIQSPDSLPDGAQDGVTMYRSKDADHLLHFTSILPSAQTNTLYTARTAANQQLSFPAAEIAYFLDAHNRPTAATSGSVPLYQLIRRQRMVAVNDSDKPGLLNTVQNADQAVVAMAVSGGGNPNTARPSAVFSLKDMFNPSNRLGAGAWLPANPGDGNLGAITDSPAGQGRAGDDVLLSNVVSFEVKVNWDTIPPPGTTTTPKPTGFASNSDYPFDTLKVLGNGGKFDTGTPNTPSTIMPGEADHTKRIRVNAVQIRIRMYDPQLKQTRQMTIVQDL